MPGSFENYIFGGSKIDFKSHTVANETYLGAKFSSGDQKKTTAANAGGLDFGSVRGYFKNQASIRIRCMDKFTDENLESVEFSIYDSDDNSSFTKRWTLSCDKEGLNESKKIPIFFSIPSNAKRYVVLHVKFVAKQSQTLTTIASGSILADMMPTRF